MRRGYTDELMRGISTPLISPPVAGGFGGAFLKIYAQDK